MYDPALASAAEIAAGYVVSDTTDPNKDFQFIEIENTGATTVPLGGLEISGGVDFTIPVYESNVNTNPVLSIALNTLCGGGCRHQPLFAIRYGAALQAQFGSNWQNLVVAGQFSNHHLNNGSDEIEVSSPAGVIQDFTYQSSWYPPHLTEEVSRSPSAAPTQATAALELRRRLGSQRGAQRHAGHGGNYANTSARFGGHQ